VVDINRKFLFFIVLLLALPVSASDADLIDYPSFFFDTYSDNLVFVIGDYASVADAIGSIDVATSLQAASGKDSAIGTALLASEIEGSRISEYNIISIGGPCANPVTSRLMGFPANCNDGFVPGRAMIKLFSNNDRIAMVVAGATAIDTQRACRVLARYESFNLAGKELQVEGTNMQDMLITHE